jgi:hypothetical protein
MGGCPTVFRGGKSVQLNGEPQFSEREFSGSVGKIPVIVDYPGPEATLIASHFHVLDVTNYMAVAALKDLRIRTPRDRWPSTRRDGLLRLFTWKSKSETAMRLGVARYRDKTSMRLPHLSSLRRWSA